MSGLMVPSSLGDFAWLEADMMSGRVSEVCEKFRALWAAPRIPSRLKLAARCLRAVGDLLEEPFAGRLRGAPGRSMLKLPWVGTENLPAAVAVVADRGESPVDDGDMTFVWRRSCVDDVVGDGRRGCSEGVRAPRGCGITVSFGRELLARSSRWRRRRREKLRNARRITLPRSYYLCLYTRVPK